MHMNKLHAMCTKQLPGFDKTVGREKQIQPPDTVDMASHASQVVRSDLVHLPLVASEAMATASESVTSLLIGVRDLWDALTSCSDAGIPHPTHTRPRPKKGMKCWISVFNT